MKIICTVNEPATFFHFLDSLSQWSIHTQKEIKEYYKKRFPLSIEDGDMLKKYILLRNKHRWACLDSDFYPASNFDEAFDNLRKRLSKEELITMSEIILHFQPKIHSIFEEYRPHLIKRKKALESVRNQKITKKAIQDIARFLESKNYPRELYVHLLVNPYKFNSGGGANIIPQNHITLEPNDLKRLINSQVANENFAVILHEAIHVLEKYTPKEKQIKFERDITKANLNHGLDRGILREAIADTLFPDGLLAIKYGLIKHDRVKHHIIKEIPLYEKDPGTYYSHSRHKLYALFYPLTKNQLKSKKSMFEGDYIRRCIDCYKEMKRLTALHRR